MKHISRRQFMKGTMLTAGYACCHAAMGTLGGTLAFAQSQAGNGRIFIVIHLDGGNDWHQSFDVAHTTPARAAYEAVHPFTRINPSLIRPTSGGYGFHPALSALHSMYQAGNVRVVRRAGTLNPSRSHDAEQLKFENGDIEDNGLGWMGRVMDAAARQGGSVSRFMTMAIDQGNPVDIQGSLVRGLGVRDLTSYSLQAQVSTADQNYRQFLAKQIINTTQATTPIMAETVGGQKAMYESIATLRSAAQSFTGRGLSNNPTLGAQYPTARPGPQLRQIAMLVRAGVGTQLSLCGMGGFDLHSDMGNENGNEANLMRSLDQAIAAFRNDMVDSGHWPNVCIAVDSEFGRTIQENGSAGKDHGAAIAQVLIGGSVRGGVTGSPITGDEFLRNNRRENWVPVQYHYANAYEEAITWLGLPTAGVFGVHPVSRLDLF